jgi:hypothetical protein
VLPRTERAKASRTGPGVVGWGKEGTGWPWPTEGQHGIRRRTAVELQCQLELDLKKERCHIVVLQY